MNTHKALEDIRVLDLTRVVAGPYSTMILADLGAEVIKLEIPDKGDDTRNYAPYKNGSSMYFANINRNKKSITLNLKTEEGRDIFRKLVIKVDVIVENFRPGVMDKLGLGYEDLKKINGQIIYAAVSGFGSYGPYSQRPGYDILAQAMGGLMSLTGYPELPPMRAGNAMGDVLGGLNLTIGILGALHARNITGAGQMVDVALVDSVVSSLDSATQRYFENGEIPQRIGNRYAPCAPYDVFHAKDTEMIIACGNQGLYEKLCALMERIDLITDERFAVMEDRVKNNAELKIIIEDWLSHYTAKEATDLILKAGIPAGPVYNLKEVSEDEHIADYREMFVEMVHPEIGPMKVNGCVIKLSDTKPEVKVPAPLLGEHNLYVYEDILGMSDDDLAKLKQQKVI